MFLVTRRCLPKNFNFCLLSCGALKTRETTVCRDCLELGPRQPSRAVIASLSLQVSASGSTLIAPCYLQNYLKMKIKESKSLSSSLLPTETSPFLWPCTGEHLRGNWIPEAQLSLPLISHINSSIRALASAGTADHIAYTAAIN